MTTKDQRFGFRGGGAVRRYMKSRARVVITAAVMLTLLAASGCGSTPSSGHASAGQSSSGGSSGGQSSSGGSSNTTGSLPQWVQQYGGDVTALLSAANSDETQISTNICNSNDAYCAVPVCSATPTAVQVLENDPPPPNASIAMQLETGETELYLAANNCSSVQDFIQGFGNIAKAAQALGLPTGA